MLDALLPKVRRDVLALLFARPDQAFYQREIVRATEGGKGAVARCTSVRASSRVPKLTLLSLPPTVCEPSSRNGLLRGTPIYGNREHGHRGLARVQPDRELPVEPSDLRREPDPGARRSLRPLTPPTPPIGREAGKREDRTAER